MIKTMKKKILFIINPKSGSSSKKEIPGLIRKFVSKNLFDFEIVTTQAPKHATQLSKEAAHRNYNVVVSIGGDGSANEVAKSLIDSPTVLGFIATGSGNGMARHLKIPMDFEKALHVITTGR